MYFYRQVGGYNKVHQPRRLVCKRGGEQAGRQGGGQEEQRKRDRGTKEQTEMDRETKR